MNEEIWIDIPECRGMYQASSLGRIRGITRAVPHSTSGTITISGRVLKQTQLKVEKYFYITTCFDAKRIKQCVHVLIARTFIGPRPEGYHVDHLDRNRLNNLPNNLCYKTPLENCGFKGEAHPNKVVNNEIVLRLREQYASGISCASLAKSFSLNYHTVHKIIKRKNWHHI